MKVKIFLTLSVSIITLSTITTTITSNITNKSTNIQSNQTDIINEIAQKYQSPNINLSTINYENYYDNLKEGSEFNNMLKNKMEINFQIYQKNDSNANFIWYNDKHGLDMKADYAKQIKNDLINFLTYAALITIISKVGQYYSINNQINNMIRTTAITQNFAIIYGLIKSNSLKGKSETNFQEFYSILETESNKIDETINKYLAKNNHNSLFSSAYNWNFNKLNYSHNLDKFDNKLSDDGGYHEVWDRLNFGSFVITVVSQYNITGWTLFKHVIRRNFTFQQPKLYLSSY
ncbi:MAG: hypothetical protein REH79_03550 [Spiroplasma sp.]|nr:hypothetical protein [Spiroplasma sp.]